MTIFSTPIAASSDDAQEASGTMTLNGANLNANLTTQVVGLRFPGVTVPPGSTINNAYLTLNLPSASYDDPNTAIRGSAEANPATFTTTTNDLTSRAKTTAAVTWSATNVGTGNRNTPDLSALVAEMIALPGWASGNAMAFYFLPNSGSALRFYAYDNGSGIASLTIDYTEPSAGGQPRRTMHQLRLRGL
jgi:hypothetical protein